MRLETKEDWCRFVKLNETERAPVLRELNESGRLSFDWRNNFDVLFDYLASGWRPWQYGLGRYFTRKEDITNYKDVVLEGIEEQEKQIFKNKANKIDKSEWVIFQYLVAE